MKAGFSLIENTLDVKFVVYLHDIKIYFSKVNKGLN